MSLRTAHPAALLCALALAACGETGEQLQQQIGERLQQRLTSTDKKSPEEPDRLPPELIVNKLSLYVDCANLTRVPLYAGFRRAGAAFAGKERAAPEPVPPEALDRCAKAEREGPLLQPPLPALEQAVAAYDVAARGFADTLAAVHEDMSQKTSTVIAQGEGSPLYARFTGSFRAWDDALRALDEQLDAQQGQIEAELLARIEARAGKGLEWYSRAAIIRAGPYVRCLGDHDEFTARVCEAFHAGFLAAHADFRAAYEGDPAAAEKVFWLPQYAESLREYKEAADALALALHEGKAEPGAIGAVIREYADALRDSESLNFGRAGGGS